MNTKKAWRKETKKLLKNSLNFGGHSILLHILDDLKREGVEEKDLYGKAARIVETHMESIENELVAKIKSLINW